MIHLKYKDLFNRDRSVTIKLLKVSDDFFVPARLETMSHRVDSNTDDWGQGAQLHWGLTSNYVINERETGYIYKYKIDWDMVTWLTCASRIRCCAALWLSTFDSFFWIRPAGKTKGPRVPWWTVLTAAPIFQCMAKNMAKNGIKSKIISHESG